MFHVKPLILSEKYDIVVIGAGHAGCEAACAAARLGSRVLLVTMNMNLIAQMSCNPSMGGVAKGQIVREIDALGGMSALVTDASMIQFRMLNRSKGPAMWSPRAQCDRMKFSEKWREVLESIPGLHIRQDEIVEIVAYSGCIKGVKTKLGKVIETRAVIVSGGTFLNGMIHIGENSVGGGRMGEGAAQSLSASLKVLGFETKRLKTGTPVRVDGRSIDFSCLTEQKGDEVPGCFSFREKSRLENQMSCFLAYTSPEVHDILRTGFEKSPLFSGVIQGVGPRYCPSIEDKIVRFAEKDRHQLFVEPEGRNTVEYYINGFSSSLPEEVQCGALRKIRGFENARIFRPGYAIEYDYFPPSQLKYTLETRIIGNLYFAGQVNGTTGYEEAAAQGLLAGINAHRKLNDLQGLVLKRSEAYMGVLIDDLISKGVDEPYRMFTSRAEYRILLRQDNADQRLCKMGYELGLLEAGDYERCLQKYEKVERLASYLKEEKISPAESNVFLERKGEALIRQKSPLVNLVLRPGISITALSGLHAGLAGMIEEMDEWAEEVVECTEIGLKYENYIVREKEIAEKITKLEDIRLSEKMDYFGIRSLSYEAREKLSRIRPETIGQASRISGVSPADISVLLVYLGR